MFSSIRKAIAIIKCACRAIKDMPLLLLIPVVFTLVIFVHVAWWSATFGYLFSVGTISKSPSGPWANVKWDDFFG